MCTWHVGPSNRTPFLFGTLVVFIIRVVFDLVFIVIVVISVVVVVVVVAVFVYVVVVVVVVFVVAVFPKKYSNL